MGHYLARHVAPEEVRVILTDWNTRNIPPLPDDELAAQLEDMIGRWFHPNELDDLCAAIGAGLVKLKRYELEEKPYYELEWLRSEGTLTLCCDPIQLLTYYSIYKLAFQNWGIKLPQRKQKDWDKALDLLLGKVQQPFVGEGFSTAGEVKDMLDWWVRHRLGRTNSDIDDRPLVKDGKLIFNISAFERSCLFAQNSRFYYQRQRRVDDYCG